MRIVESIHKLIIEENIAEAHNVVKNYIDKNPKDIFGYIALSDIFYEEDLFQKALYVLDDALKIIPDNKVLLEHKLSSMIELGLHTETKAIINQIIDMDGLLSSTVYGQLGFILSLEGDHNEAVINYKKAIEIYDKDSVSIFNLGVSYRSLYLYDDAIAMFEKAFILSEDERKHTIEHIINNTKDDKKKSIFETEKLIRFPGNPDIFNLLVPSNFDAKLTNNILNIVSPDDKIVIMLSYSNEHSDEEGINAIFKDFKSQSGIMYSVIKPFSILNREDHNDLYGSSIFITKARKSMFHAISILYKESKIIILTITSSIVVSNNLINLTESIINSLHFKDIPTL